jgi:hypothetical protein
VTLDGDKPKTGWSSPMPRRTRTIVIVVASVIIVGAIVATVLLGIPFF